MRTSFYTLFSLVVISGLAAAQTQSGWRRFDQPAREEAAPASQLTIQPGTFVTVRVDQPLSSDHNQPGDAFSATLMKPIVVDGIVVAQRGQTVAGRVVEAEKAGRAKGVSRLGVQLTELTLVDGQQVPLETQLVSRTAGTSAGRDVGAVAGATALGAAIGGAADYGRGAAIGAGAGAAAGIIGVLLTRGRATVIYPESLLTFRVDRPVNISTERAPNAFRYVEPGEYERTYEVQRRPPPPPPPPYYYGPVYYPHGPSLVVFSGPRIYGPRYYYGGYRVFRRW